MLLDDDEEGILFAEDYILCFHCCWRVTTSSAGRQRGCNPSKLAALNINLSYCFYQQQKRERYKVTVHCALHCATSAERSYKVEDCYIL